MNTAQPHAAAPSAPVRSPWPLRIVLALLAAGNIFGFFFGLTRRDAVVAEFPRLGTWIWPVYLACPLAGLIAIVATFQWRRRGFWLLIVLGGVVLAIELYAMGWGIHVSRIFVATVLLFLCARPVWGRFR